ncbi:MAG: cation-translocating P-type ATPase, partial [Christensenellales bacterium]
AIISITIALIHKNYSDLFEGGVILFIVILNAIIGVIQESKAEDALESLKKSTEPDCKVIRNGKLKKIKTSNLTIGDIVVLEAGDIVPADLRLIETYNLKCDESALTGESLSVTKDATLILKENTSLGDRKNMAYSSTVISFGRGKGVVTGVGLNTEIGKIANMLNTTSKDLTPLEKSIKKVGKIISVTVLIVAVVIFVVEIFFAEAINIWNAFLVSVTLAVAAIPESLPAVITIIMAMGLQNLAKRGAIVKRLKAVETLGSCEIICSDKTGTLTQNKMHIAKFSYNLKIFSKPENFCNELDLLTKAMVLCNDSFVGENDKIVGDPTETALLEFAIQNKLNQNASAKYKRIYELGFDSDRKLMSTVNLVDGMGVCFTKGAYDQLIQKCKYIVIDGEVKLLNDQIIESLNEINSNMGLEALRVLAFAYKCVDNDYTNLENDLIFVGLAGMIDPPRVEAKQAIKKCYEAGLKPIMITGDSANTAYAIAKELGIASNKKQVLTGEMLDKLSEEKFLEQLDSFKVFARVSPEHKVRIVKAFKKQGKIVAMTGDGVNDAPSLKIADIGVGMGITGTDVTKSVADMIVTDDNFATIVVAVEEGRKVYSNIQKTIQFLLSTNIVEVVTMFLSIILFPNYNYLFPAQLLFINLVTDSLPAFSLGVEKAESDIMSKKPRKSSDTIFSGGIGRNIIYQSVLQILIVMIIFVWGIKTTTNEVASTMVFMTISIMQLIHSINCKSEKSIFKINIFNNKVFNICFVATTLINLSVFTLPFFREIFNVAPLNLIQWIVVIACSISIIPLVELGKLFARIFEKHKRKKIKQKD